MNYAEVLQSKFRDYSAKQAIIFEEEILTYDELNRTVNRVSEFLRRKGVKKGDRVAIQLSKCLEIIYFYLACLASGAIALQLNDAYKSAEVEYYIKNSGSSLFVTDAENYLKSKEMLQRIPELKVVTLNEKFPEVSFYPEEMEEIKSCPEPSYPGRNGDTAMILYTSGTTGKSKGAMISHRSLIENMEDLHKIWELSDHDISLHTLPLVHGHGLILALLGALYAGATTIMHRKFDPGCVWDTIEEKPILTKYQLALTLCQKEKFDKGHNPYQDAHRLITLRNALVHYKPEWDTDLNEHKKLESYLSNRFLVSPFSHVNDAFYAHDFKGKIIDVNVNSCKMLGYKKEELIGQHLSTITSEEEALLIKKRMKILIKEKKLIFIDSGLRNSLLLKEIGDLEKSKILENKKS